jgi:hypothetical protein
MEGRRPVGFYFSFRIITSVLPVIWLSVFIAHKSLFVGILCCAVGKCRSHRWCSFSLTGAKLTAVVSYRGEIIRAAHDIVTSHRQSLLDIFYLFIFYMFHALSSWSECFPLCFSCHLTGFDAVWYGVWPLKVFGCISLCPYMSLIVLNPSLSVSRRLRIATARI